jgi:hypothetical protein
MGFPDTPWSCRNKMPDIHLENIEKTQIIFLHWSFQNFGFVKITLELLIKPINSPPEIYYLQIF